MKTVTHRLDNFTDAAFAFAVTLVVIGAGSPPRTTPELVRAIADIPAFAIGFALLAMFWFAHVSWRRLRGEGDARSVLLTILLVFLVLLYVHPLRMMASGASFALTGTRQGEAPLGQSYDIVWQVYGLGFAAMAAVTAFLFADARRNPELRFDGLQEARGNMHIYAILALTGICSAALATFEASLFLAPWAYATLPATIGLFSFLFFRSPPEEKAEG